MKRIGTIGKYNIMLSGHAAQRSRQRDIDIYKVVSAILAFGESGLTAYEKQAADVMLKDTDNDFSIVFAVKAKRIEIITLISGADCWAKTGTRVERI
jgi:hypothetical protein